MGGLALILASYTQRRSSDQNLESISQTGLLSLRRANPSHQLMIYTGLAKKTSTPEALAGVIGHELAHIQKDHVMQSLVREIGLGTLFTIISGGDFSMVSEIGRMVSSTAFSRNLEKEADLVGLTYIQNAQIDPKPFAEFIGVIHDYSDRKSVV